MRALYNNEINAMFVASPQVDALKNLLQQKEDVIEEKDKIIEELNRKLRAAAAATHGGPNHKTDSDNEPQQAHRPSSAET